MASIRTIAQDMIDVARNGIGWIALWKDGKGWMGVEFWPDDVDENGTPTFDDFDTKRLLNIAKRHHDAIIVNSYYHNLGDTTCMTRDSLADALRWQYDLQSYTLADLMEQIIQPAQEPAAHAEPITANDLDEMHKNEDEKQAAYDRMERSVTLTNAEWNRLVCYLHMTTKHREGEREAWNNLAQEKNQDGTPVFISAADNAAYWTELCKDLERMIPKLDGMEGLT